MHHRDCRFVCRAVPGALAAWLLCYGAAAAQQALPLYVTFELQSDYVANLFDDDKPVVEQRLSNAVLDICDKQLRVWVYKADRTKYPRLKVWLEESNAELTMHLDLQRAPGQQRDLRGIVLFKPGPNPLTANLVEKAVLDSLRKEFVYHDKRVAFIDRLKDELPLGQLARRSLSPLAPGQARWVLPLQFD